MLRLRALVMTDEKRDSTRDLLDAVDSSWTPAPGPISSPDIASLDAGWADDDEEEDEEAPEEPLPDEGLDPAAYAAAKKAREEREAQRRDRRRAKAAAKKAKQRAREAAARDKQKTQKKKPRPSSRPQAAIAEDDTRDEQPIVSQARPIAKKPPVRVSTNATMLAIGVVVFLAVAAIVAALIADR